MSETDRQTGTPAAPRSAPKPVTSKRSSLLARIGHSIRQFGIDTVSVAVGRLLEPAAGEEEHAAAKVEDDAEKRERARRVSTLHNVAEQLRGAADDYLAVKLDEIEARVDTKLDEIEERIDEKVVELHETLRQMRDQELRHRLRLLKITLIFTVLVALLSLGYKWVSSLL